VLSRERAWLAPDGLKRGNSGPGPVSRFGGSSRSLPGWHHGTSASVRVHEAALWHHVHVPDSAHVAMFVSEVLLLGARLCPLMALSPYGALPRDLFAARLPVASLTPARGDLASGLVPKCRPARPNLTLRDSAPAIVSIMKMRARKHRQRNRFWSAEATWRPKREQQRQDLDDLRAGQSDENQTSWFSGGRARSCSLVDSPY